MFQQMGTSVVLRENLAGRFSGCLFQTFHSVLSGREGSGFRNRESFNFICVDQRSSCERAETDHAYYKIVTRVVVVAHPGG
jgi:hypothetical protein